MSIDALSADSPAAPAAGEYLVEMLGIVKRYPGVTALDGVDLILRPGEIHALAGENGSGKSTLAKVLYGANTPDAGEVRIAGEAVRFAGGPRDAVRHGVAAISQELSLAPELTVSENILMGRLPRRRGRIQWDEVHAQGLAALQELDVAVDPRALVSSLSVEEQQSVEIVRALSLNPRILVLDEATSSLTEHATAALLARLRVLRDRGVAVVLISHRLQELFDCADRVTVLRDGQLIGERLMADLDEPELVRMMVGRDVQNLYGVRHAERGGVRLQVRDLAAADGSVHGVDLEVAASEIVGIAGLVGCGKRQLGRILAGADAATGHLAVDGDRVRLGDIRSALDAGIVLTPDDRKGEAIFPVRSVRENFSLAWVEKTRRLGVMRLKGERTFVDEQAQEFAVRAASHDVPIGTLSGGNQQKIVLGRWFSTEPRVAVLAEPTRGIDVGAKAEVYRLVQALSARGCAVVVISSEMTELLGLADRIAVMYQGTIAATYDRADATEELITHTAMGGA